MALWKGSNSWWKWFECLVNGSEGSLLIFDCYKKQMFIIYYFTSEYWLHSHIAWCIKLWNPVFVCLFGLLNLRLPSLLDKAVQSVSNKNSIRSGQHPSDIDSVFSFRADCSFYCLKYAEIILLQSLTQTNEWWVLVLTR